MCGTVVDTQATATIPNPWSWPIYLQAIIAGQTIDLISPEDNFQYLIKVRLNELPRAYTDHRNDDYGSPVYYPYYSGHGQGRHIVRAQPVGILLGYFPEVIERDDRCVLVYYMYCVSVERILRGSDLQLLGENFA